MHGAKDFSYFRIWFWGQDVHLDQLILGTSVEQLVSKDTENLQRIFQEARDRGGSWMELDGCPDFLSYHWDRKMSKKEFHCFSGKAVKCVPCVWEGLFVAIFQICALGIVCAFHWHKAKGFRQLLNYGVVLRVQECNSH